MMTTSLNEITPGMVRATIHAGDNSVDRLRNGRAVELLTDLQRRTHGEFGTGRDVLGQAVEAGRSESVNTNTPTTIATLTTTAMVVSANRIFLSSRFLIVRRNIDQSPRLFIMSSTPSGVGSRNSSTILPSTRKMTRLAYDAATGRG